MKKYTLGFSAFLLIVVLFAGCRSKILETPAITLTELTKIHRVSATTTPSLAAPLQISASSPTPTRLPTLPAPLQRQLFDILGNNGGCELPCFLGLMPGKTNWQDAKDLLGKFLAGPFMPDAPDNLLGPKTYYRFMFTSYESILQGHFQFDVDADNVIQDVILKADYYAEPEWGPYDKHLSKYSVGEVFRSLGEPDLVYVYYSRANLVYSLTIVYENVKLVIEYTGLAKLVDNEQYRLCPNFGDGDVVAMELAVASSSNSIDVKSLIGYPFWEGSSTTEEASGLSLVEFYRLMMQSKEHACFHVRFH
jgi:hypothetical protein